jgi:hypothetical protein
MLSHNVLRKEPIHDESSSKSDGNKNWAGEEGKNEEDWSAKKKIITNPSWNYSYFITCTLLL